MSAPFGEFAANAEVTGLLHGRPAALDPLETFAGDVPTLAVLAPQPTF
jgi:hypothetical protein